ncbi:DNA-directed RNA polymerase subunit beta [Staphylococcus pseudintermedius]|nr:DNA-directed RNA polymerase subunit beta [Staphylococcus pseudintermedius]EGQ3097176.1 DNA-directed RNA polymerase subunit beta [Staphylococcus pseudintermedius]EGQ3575416.1 DNA-directed RNA polymerase subunit beta [Staphylococcus pseudintermedius]EGQ3627844.1 DNA-directed RNA polymerase subunit beta [Staphylococcus pseudintermedius]EGQ3978582.1 DNA-directed RNA polymerase subunit beta [Staphylococcus pseudintermedius]
MKELITKWRYGLQTLMDSTSFKLTLFVFIAIMMFVVGLMTGFIINHDNVLNTFNLRFWQHIIETIGGHH